MKIKGSVTIFLGLSLGFFILLIEVLAKGAIINAERTRFEASMDIAMNSVLGEFNKILYSNYDLLYVDASYQSKSPSINNINDRLLMYMKKNTQEVLGKDNGPWGMINISSSGIEKFQGACGGNGMSFRNQANIFVEDSKSLMNLHEMVKDVGRKAGGIEEARNTNILEDWSQLMEMIAGKELPKKVNPKTKEVEIVELNNPADTYFSQSQSDLFSLVSCTKPGNISFDTSSLVSNQGAVNTSIYSDFNSDKETFITYLLDKMSCFLTSKEHLLQCELEYIINSSSDDYENFKYVAEEIYKIQLSLNYQYVISDGYYTSKAYSEAEALEVCTLDPTFIEPVANSILYAYAFIEALKDMNSVMNGGSGEDGLSYRQYVISMLLMLDDYTLNYKSMDLIELEVRRLDMNPEFKMDWCIERIDCEMTGSGSGPEIIKRRRMYGYF